MIARKTSHVRRPLIAIYIAIPVLLALVVAAGAQPPADYEPRVDDRGGHALDALHAALARAERGQGRARLLFWGASHTASDQYTGVLREALARRFGDAGPGVVPGALPFELYAHRQVDVRSQGAWRALRTHGRAAERDAYGVTGVAFEAGSHARTELVLRAGVRPIDYADVLYYARPGGGSLGVRLDAGPFRTIRASGAPGSRVERVTGPARRVRLETQGSVRVFGVSLERAAPGVIVDARANACRGTTRSCARSSSGSRPIWWCWRTAPTRPGSTGARDSPTGERSTRRWRGCGAWPRARPAC